MIFHTTKIKIKIKSNCKAFFNCCSVLTNVKSLLFVVLLRGCTFKETVTDKNLTNEHQDPCPSFQKQLH